MRRRILFFLFFFASLSLGQMAWAEERQLTDEHITDEHITDEKGRTYRVNFPLHDRIFFDAFFRSSTKGSTSLQFQPGLRLGLSHSFALDYPEEEIWWHFRHTWLTTELNRNGGLRASLLESTYLRHDKSGSIVIPSNVDLRFPAPFDIAIEYSLLDMDFDTSRPTKLHINVATFAFLLDFIRDPAYRHRLAIGPVLSYRISSHENLQPEPTWTHSFIPTTAGRIVYEWESETGRFGAGAEVQCAARAHLFPEGLQWHRHCDMGARAERALVAINDRPIYLFASGSIEETTLQVAGESNFVWSARLGLRLSLPQ